jgi:hypothetical protein
MTKKTEMKTTETLDSLLESKEQTDKALAELADALREKLRRLDAVIERPQTADGSLQQMQTKAVEIFELRIGKRFWTWFWRVVAFVVMFIFIWGAMALLKEPKANGGIETADCGRQTAEEVLPHRLRLPPLYPDEPAKDLEQESEEKSLDNGEESNSELLTSNSLLLSPPTVQRQRIRLFQRRL